MELHFDCFMKLVKLVSLLIASLFFLQSSYPASKEQFPLKSIVIYGDTRTDHTTHQKVVNSIMKIKPSVVFHTGDLVEDGFNPSQWIIFNKTVSIRENQLLMELMYLNLIDQFKIDQKR